MKRSFLLTTAVIALGTIVPATAAAAILELGKTTSPLVAPTPCTTKGTVTTCPHGLAPNNYGIVLTQVTAMETVRDGVSYPTTVTRPGRIVAFTLGLSRLDTNRSMARADIKSLDADYGGTTRAAVTVLQPVNKRQRKWKVAAQSSMVHLQPYLGQVVQFPLDKSLPVKRGDVIALTVPTWAPVLSIALTPTSKFAYRQSRASNCMATPTTEYAQSVGQTAIYKCDYTGTRVEYTATEVTNPVAVNPIH